MQSHEIIATYESILTLTSQMLDAARQSDWDRLVEHEAKCKELVDRLRINPPAALEPEARKRKVEIIHRVLADDAEIRNLTEPWMARLQHLLSGTRQERKLRAAYGPGS